MEKVSHFLILMEMQLSGYLKEYHQKELRMLFILILLIQKDQLV